MGQDAYASEALFFEWHSERRMSTPSHCLETLCFFFLHLVIVLRILVHTSKPMPFLETMDCLVVGIEPHEDDQYFRVTLAEGATTAVPQYSIALTPITIRYVVLKNF